MKCDECGSDRVYSTEEFCPDCGQPVDALTCDKCGAWVNDPDGDGCKCDDEEEVSHDNH